MSGPLDEAAVITALVTAFGTDQFPGLVNVAKVDLLDEEVRSVSDLAALADRRFEADYEPFFKTIDWLSPEGFRYFIAGYLLHLLRCNLDSSCDSVATYYLLPATAQMLENGYDDSRFQINMRILSPGQKRAIALFWMYARERYSDYLIEEFWDYGEESRYWDRYL